MQQHTAVYTYMHQQRPESAAVHSNAQQRTIHSSTRQFTSMYSRIHQATSAHNYIMYSTLRQRTAFSGTYSKIKR